MKKNIYNNKFKFPSSTELQFHLPQTVKLKNPMNSPNFFRTGTWMPLPHTSLHWSEFEKVHIVYRTSVPPPLQPTQSVKQKNPTHSPEPELQYSNVILYCNQLNLKKNSGFLNFTELHLQHSQKFPRTGTVNTSIYLTSIKWKWEKNLKFPYSTELNFHPVLLSQ